MTAGEALHLSYGGTFDPVHFGHLAVARAAAARFGVATHLVPCADPPHRARPGADREARAQMLQLAIAGDPQLRLDRRELERGGASYTVDTLRELRTELGPAVPIACLIGADAFRNLPAWREWTALFDLAHIVVATRPGHALDDLPPALAVQIARRRADLPEALGRVPGGAVLALAVPAWPVSSTRVRAALAAGDPVKAWVPKPVRDYIAARRLYR